jgi:hypothetical protein
MGTMIIMMMTAALRYRFRGRELLGRPSQIGAMANFEKRGRRPCARPPTRTLTLGCRAPLRPARRATAVQSEV